MANGRKPGIYTDWDTANNEAILGGKGPKYKKFSTRTEAENFIRQNGSLHTIRSLGLLPDEGDDDEDDADDDEAVGGGGALLSAGTKIKTEPSGHVNILRNPDGLGMPDAGFHDRVLHIYTDGSSKRNGMATARGGVGVFFGHDDPRLVPSLARPSGRDGHCIDSRRNRNIAEALEGEPQTNQRAELAAIMRALQVAPVDQNVMIITDSTYSINCLTSWKDGWIKNGWKTSQGVDVLNQDLIKGTLARIEERKKAGVNTHFEWVKGHAQSPGNIAADELAVKGAKGW